MSIMKLISFFKQHIPPRYSRSLGRLRRRLYELFGSDKLSRPSLYQMDRKLQRYLPHRNGFFIEAGANNGYSQSNTYYFERMRGRKGILIEGIPQLYEKCRKERSQSTVLNYALVAKDYLVQTVRMRYSGLMSLVEGAQKSIQGDLEHIKKGIEIQGIDTTYEVIVPARTLTSILDELAVEKIDLFSLDVEGYELEVLKGLNLDKYRPKYMLVEARFRLEIESYLSNYNYEAVDRFSEYDILYKRKEG